MELIKKIIKKKETPNCSLCKWLGFTEKNAQDEICFLCIAQGYRHTEVYNTPECKKLYKKSQDNTDIT